MSKQKHKEVPNETISFKSCNELKRLNDETNKVSKAVSEVISKLYCS